MKTNNFLSYLAHFFLEWEIFQTKVVEKIKTHILFSVTVFRKSCRLWDNVEKYCRAGQLTDINMAHARYMLEGYKYTPSVCVILIAFPLQQWLHERACVTLHAHCLSCLSRFQRIQTAYLERADYCLVPNRSLLIIHYHFPDILNFI